MALLFKAFSVEQDLHRQVLEERLAAIDTATKLAAASVVKGAAESAQAVELARSELASSLGALREFVLAEITHGHRVADERFTSVDQRFDERDVRTGQAAVAGKQALDAALQAAKELNEAQALSGNELNAAQARAFAEASAKSESNFTKLIDAQGAQMQAMEKGLAGQIQELKERVDRGEGKDTGTSAARTSAGDQVTRVVAALSLIVAVIIAVVIIARGGK